MKVYIKKQKNKNKQTNKQTNKQSNAKAWLGSGPPPQIKRGQIAQEMPENQIKQ